MSKKAIQEEINAKVLEMVDLFNKGFEEIEPVKRLRSCSACVHTCTLNETGEVVYVLQSYGTLIAIISGNTLYDFLRYVYGYTSTSAQHIAKFRSDYLKSYILPYHEYRYYPV